MKLSKFGADIAENTNTWGGAPGSVQPAVCAGCEKNDRMSIPRLADGRKYWVCDHCGYPHESEETQGTANGTSAYANPFVVGDFVREPGSWAVFHVTEAYRSGSRGNGYFKAQLVVDGLKYHRLGKTIFEDAARFKKVADAAVFIRDLGSQYSFHPVKEPTT